MSDNNPVPDVVKILRTLRDYSDSDIVQQILRDAFDPITEDQKDQKPTDENSPNTTKEKIPLV